MSIIIALLTIVEVLVCLLLILIIMMQRPRQEGLGASFGSGVMDQTFGVQTTNVLQKGTTWLAGAMFATTILLAALVASQHRKNETTRFEAPKPATTADAKPADAKATPADPAKSPAPATNGPALKLTPGGGPTTSPIINVQPDGSTSSKLPNGAGTVVVKPGNPGKAPAAQAPVPAAAPAPAPVPAAAPTAPPAK